MHIYIVDPCDIILCASQPVHRQIEMCRFNDAQRAETKLFTHTVG